MAPGPFTASLRRGSGLAYTSSRGFAVAGGGAVQTQRSYCQIDTNTVAAGKPAPYNVWWPFVARWACHRSETSNLARTQGRGSCSRR